jgi:hypothetical protein
VIERSKAAIQAELERCMACVLWVFERDPERPVHVHCLVLRCLTQGWTEAELFQAVGQLCKLGRLVISVDGNVSEPPRQAIGVALHEAKAEELVSVALFENPDREQERAGLARESHLWTQTTSGMNLPPPDSSEGAEVDFRRWDEPFLLEQDTTQPKPGGEAFSWDYESFAGFSWSRPVRQENAEILPPAPNDKASLARARSL